MVYGVNTVKQPTTSIYDISYFRLLNNNLLSRNNIRMAQKLSPTARRAKAARDKRYAMSEWGKYKKRTAQKIACPKGYDYDHRTKKCIKSSQNRAGGSNGTKNETTRKRYGY